MAVSAALSTGELLSVPRLRETEAERLQRRLARAKRGSSRRDTCHACGQYAAGNRESQAVFRRHACGHGDQADVNAAKNIAAGRAVIARGALQPLGGAANREPQPVSSPV
jgi:hypothetical protein